MENIETKRLAENLQQRLKDFVEMKTPDRERQLPILTSYIFKNARAEILEKLINKNFQNKLVRAILTTLTTPFYIGNKEVIPWQGGYTVVVIDDKGTIVGMCHKPVDELFKTYGELTPYALSKAVLLLHLEKTGLKGGLDNQHNYEYIRNLLPPESSIFTGTSQEPLLLDRNVYYLGGSGCAVKKEYLSELLGAAVPHMNTQAGRFDSIFTELTKEYISNPITIGSFPAGIPEPEMIQNIRRNN